MTRRKRKRRAKNKITGSSEGALIKADFDPYAAGPAAVYRTYPVTVVRSTLFSAEFEAVIEIIARERVYRAMLAGLGRRLLMLNPSDH